VSTNIALSLSDGIGVIALANADDKDSPISDIIVAVAQKAFNITTSSVSSTDEQPTSTAPPTKRRWHADVTARSNTTSALSPLSLEGTYYDAGYGSILLCSVLSSSPPCQSVLADFHSVDNSLSPNSTDLFAPWNGVTNKHIRFTHTNDSQYSYSISVGTIYPQGYGKNSTPFSTVTLAPSTAAEFVVENNTVIGFGVSGIDEVERVGTVEEASDVWFVKVA
jgi:hypothetical protein